MKINRLEAHDRLLFFKKDQEDNINQGIDDCRYKNPYSLALQQRSPYIYIFAHPRTAEDGVNKRMLWQPRLSKPTPQTNSYLFRATKGSNDVEVCWMIPPREHWKQSDKGNVTANEWVTWSVDQYINNREEMSKPFPDDFTEAQIRVILQDIAREMDEERNLKKWSVKKDGLIT